MKCPKCGSENTVGLTSDMIFCADCLYKWEIEPSTAEKLLWLAEHKGVEVYRVNQETIVEIGLKVFSGNTLSEAIDKAYKWAKEEQNADN